METPFNYIKSINSMAITVKNEADRQEKVGSKSRKQLRSGHGIKMGSQL